MSKAKSDKRLIRDTVREEYEYLKNVKSTKPSSNCDGLYKLCKNYNGDGFRQHGGLLGALIPLLRVASPFIIDWAINKFTGSGFQYRNVHGDPLNEEEKKLILLNILSQYPHLYPKIFS